MVRIKTCLQTEAAECGLACLVMVANYYGNGMDLREGRQSFQASLKGIALTRLIGMANAIGLQSRALRLELSDLARLRTPAVLHWDLSHFVVLEAVRGNSVTIVDPAFGKRKLSMQEVSKHFTGVALELWPTGDFEKREKPPAVSLRQLTGRVQGLFSSLALIFCISVGLQVLALFMPFLNQWVIDQALVSADNQLLVVLGIGFGLALLIQVMLSVFRGWAVLHLSASLGLQWTGNVFGHLLKLPLEFFEKRYLGDIVSRMSSIQSIQRTLTTNFIEALLDGMMAVATLLMMIVYSWKLALVSMFAVALYVALRMGAYLQLRTAIETQMNTGAKLQSNLLESLRGIQSIKIAGREPMRHSRYLNLLSAATNADVRLSQLGLAFASANQLLFGLDRVVVICLGAYFSLQGIFSVGALIAYLSYKEQFVARVSGLIDKLVEVRMLRLHGERLADIVLTAPEPRLQDLVADAPEQGTSVCVDNLAFRYAEGEPWVIKDCSFRVEQGESVAIVGPSGCGKTTLMKLLVGLLGPSQGRILFGEQDILKLGSAAYRARIGAVMQDDQLFAGSVADNIAFSDDALDLPRVEAASRLAGVHEEILAMPMGYQSLIGDMGTTLSGGQKQRVLLARALYRRPAILFLDEATSHLDVEKEKEVNAAIRMLRITRIMIAHRQETIANADLVLSMSEGRIVDRCRPAEMLAPLPRRRSAEPSLAPAH